MKPRQAEVDLYYNGAAVKTVMDEYITDISYTDPASGAADSLDISIHDRARQWITAWMPISGDTLSAKYRSAAMMPAAYRLTAALWPRCVPRIGRASP